MKPDILNKHIQVMQQIVDFIQSMGWSIDGLRVFRYDDNGRHGFFGPGDEDDKIWKIKEPVYKWGLELQVAPKDEDDDKKARERHPAL